jgi:hypothetical protein
MTSFIGTEYASDTCPRRHLLNNSDVVGTLSLWRSCEGNPGVAALSSLSPHTIDAFEIIASGRAARTAEIEKRHR